MHPIAIVTGGSSNIGHACVQRFRGTHRVLIGDLQAPRDSSAAVEFEPTDVSNPQDCVRLVERASAMGSVEIVVHSAAVTAPPLPIEQIPVDEWRRLIEVNLNGAFFVARAAIPALRRSRGAMVMIASRAARTGYAALAASPAGTKAHYCASKAGLLSLVRSLAIELAPDGVRVNAVVPGSIEGAMIPRERWTELAARIPLGRLGLPEEIAECVAFLCSTQSRYVTGHALDVNGGSWMN